MNGHYGRLVTILYRSVGPMLNASVLRIEFRAPDGELYTQDVGNVQWDVRNPALQFLATQGYRPSDLDGTRYDAEDDKNHFLIVPDSEHEWLLSMDAVREGPLRDAEWFDATDDEEDDDGPNQNPGGGDPDPSTGNRAGVEIDLADEDSDQGVNVTVS